MDQIIITELPKEGHIRVYKIASVDKTQELDEYGTIRYHSDVLGTLRVFKDQFIWVRDIFSHRKIGRKTAINYFKNNEQSNSRV
jgi:hypothetical protein